MAVSAYPGGRAAQTSAKDPEEVELTVISSVAEVSTATDVVPPEAPAATLAPAAPVANPTPVPEESAYVPRPVMERGSGSTSAEFFPCGDTMGELARQVVQQFFASMRSCIDLILSGNSSFEFARMFLENLVENINLAGGPSPAKACQLLVEQLGHDLKELRSLENAGSFHEAQETLTRLLAAQEQERREMEERIAERTRLLQCFQADHRKLTGESKESEMVMQAAKQVILDARATIARAEALIAINEQKFATSEKRLAELEAAKAQVEENLSVSSQAVIPWGSWRVKWCSSSLPPCDHVLISSYGEHFSGILPRR